MEVHTHTHTAADPDPLTSSGHRGRKKWTHYFWEFLMLFLAVFCGFLAENQREHYIESLRAKEYAKSLINDIKSDTADIQKGIKHVRFYASAIDSVCNIATVHYGNSLFPGTFYYYSRLATNAFPIDWSRSTLNQLVQSGNLRYIKNKNLVNKINRYYALQSNIDGLSETDSEQRESIRSLRNKILDNRFLSVFILNVTIDDAVDKKLILPVVDSLKQAKLPLQKGGEQYLHEYLNNMNDRSIRLKFYAEQRFSSALLLAIEIMNMLKDEYHLK